MKIRTFADLMSRMEMPTRYLGSLEGDSVCWATEMESIISGKTVRIISRCRVPEGVKPETPVFPHVSGFAPDHGECFFLECGN